MPPLGGESPPVESGSTTASRSPQTLPHPSLPQTHRNDIVPEAWDSYKDVIQRLYLHEDKPLHVVMRRMLEEYGFHASAKQYKMRFRKWEWGKNLNRDQRTTILRAAKAQGAVGEHVQVMQRGKRINPQKIRRWMRSAMNENETAEPLEIAEAVNSDSRGSSPADVAVFTPPKTASSSIITGDLRGQDLGPQQLEQETLKGRKGPLPLAKRRKVSQIRKVGACSACRQAKKACSLDHHPSTFPMQDLPNVPDSPITRGVPSIFDHTLTSPRHSPVRFARELEADVNHHVAISAQDSAIPHEHVVEPDSAENSTQLIPASVRILCPWLDCAASFTDWSSLSTHQLAANHFSQELSQWRGTSDYNYTSNQDFVPQPTLAAELEPRRYQTVSALLICWEDEEETGQLLNVMKDIYTIFARVLHFRTRIFKIPFAKCNTRLQSEFLSFCSDSEDLKIVYYAGVGKVSEDGQFLWCSRSNQHLTISWTTCQLLLEEGDSDVLLLFDCLFVLPVAKSATHIAIECLAASGIDQPYSSYRFSSTLFYELASLSSKTRPFHIGTLYFNILKKLLTVKEKITPVHVTLGAGRMVYLESLNSSVASEGGLKPALQFRDRG